MIEKGYSVAEAAARIKRSTRTVHRYIRAGMFPGLIVIERPERNQYVFTETCIAEFLKSRGQDNGTLEQPDKPVKRAYHKTYVKGKHRRKRKHVKRVA